LAFVTTTRTNRWSQPRGSNNQETAARTRWRARQDPALLRSAGGYGAGRDRTGDLRLAKAALSQLSYSPEGMVGLSGFEPLTSRLSAVRSSQLSYRPVVPPRPCAPRGCLLFQERTAAPGGGRGGSLKTRQRAFGSWASPTCGLLRKEVIQPQVLLQLPCYDFTPITDHTVGTFPPYGSERRLLVQPAFVM
jgi:hypothetical protein